jgi:hypothetical protein
MGDDVLTVSPPIYIVGMKIACWKCGERMPVVALLAPEVEGAEREAFRYCCAAARGAWLRAETSANVSISILEDGTGEVLCEHLTQLWNVVGRFLPAFRARGTVFPDLRKGSRAPLSL